MTNETKLNDTAAVSITNRAPIVSERETHRPVVSIFDGDAIEVLHNHHPERTRLSGIDCPEQGQA